MEGGEPGSATLGLGEGARHEAPRRGRKTERESSKKGVKQGYANNHYPPRLSYILCFPISILIKSRNPTEPALAQKFGILKARERVLDAFAARGPLSAIWR